MKLNRNIIQLSLVSVGIFLILGTYFLYPKIKEKKFIQNETVVKEQDVEKKTNDITCFVIDDPPFRLLIF